MVYVSSFSWVSAGTGYTPTTHWIMPRQYDDETDSSVSAYKETLQPKLKEEIQKPKPLVCECGCKKEDTVELLSVTGIIVVVIVSLLAVRFINWRNVVRMFVTLIWKPAKREATTVKTEWDSANNGKYAWQDDAKYPQKTE